MRYASVCSGVSPHSQAYAAMGWEAVFFSEIEAFPSAVLAHHYPNVPNLGDMTKIDGREWRGKIDVLMASCPCQAFSVAGLRKSLSDDRGNLTLEFVKLADVIDPRVIVYENVPGILNTDDNAFGCFLGALVGADSELVPARGQRWTDAGMVIGPKRRAAWRVFDAQYFGLAQRRRRVFVVASPRDGTDPSQVLLIEQGVPRHTPPSREAEQGFTHDVAPCIGASGRGFERSGETRGQDPVIACFGGNNTTGQLDVATACNAHGGPAGRLDFESETFAVVAFSAKDHGADATEDCSPTLRAGNSDKSHANSGNWMAVALGPIYPINDMATRHAGTDGSGHDCGKGHGLGIGGPEDPMFTLTKGDKHAVAQPYTLAIRGRGDTHNLEYRQDGLANAVLTPNGGRGGIGVGAVATHMAVRRLTPKECERLQGWTDGYTLIERNGKPAADGPRYKAIGNGWANPCLVWIGKRIEIAEEVHA